MDNSSNRNSQLLPNILSLASPQQNTRNTQIPHSNTAWQANFHHRADPQANAYATNYYPTHMMPVPVQQRNNAYASHGSNLFNDASSNVSLQLCSDEVIIFHT